MTERADPRETHEDTVPALPNGNLLELVRFLARAAAEADFQEHMTDDDLAGSGHNTEHSPQKDHSP